MSNNKTISFPARFEMYGGEMGRLICSKDWRNTPLGDMDKWPQHLTTLVTLCLTSQFPVAIWWGKDLTKIYNESFGYLFDLNHEEAFGTRGKDLPLQLWDLVGSSLKVVTATGEATESHGSFTMSGGGAYAKRDITFHYSPIVGENGVIDGVFTTASEVVPEAKADEAGNVNENELRMQLALQVSALGTYDWDIMTSTFQFSERLRQIFGFSGSKKVMQKDLLERLHPDDLAIRQKAHDDALKTGTLFYEARIIWPDESVHWVRFQGRLVFDQNGKPKRMYGTALDITDSKLHADELEKKVRERTSLLEKMNEDLRRSEERYYKMTEEVQDYAIILLDKDGTILNWNRGAEKIKGYAESEIIGKNFSIFYLDEDRKRHLPGALIRRAEVEGRAMHEGWRTRKDGSKFWGSVVITALHDDLNNIIGFTKVTRDLTERKMAEDIMKQHASELEIKNKQLEQFAYIASHDLQEPLRKIQTFVQVLERKLDNPEVRQKYFHKILSSAKRMGDLIQAVLNYSRLTESDELKADTDLNEILEHVKSDYELLIEEKHATIESNKLPTIRAVPLQISQLFANLIGNSLKFAVVPSRITISCRMLKPEEIRTVNSTLDDSRKYVELVFRDNGIGFDQQYAEKIFTIFQRLNSREDYSGTGIGLALCKRIVENHHGHIHAVGATGKGAAFFVYLPFE